MSPEVVALLSAALSQERTRGELLKAAFLARTAQRREVLQARIIEERDRLLNDALSRSTALAASNARMQPFLHAVRGYASQSDWNLVDPLLLLACFDTVADETIARLSRVSLVYHGFRMVDDAIDGHLDYKGGYSTLYGTVLKQPGANRHASSLTILAALVTVCEGLRGATPATIEYAERTLSGAIHELQVDTGLRDAEYDAIVEGKMVNYGMLLYGPVVEGITPECQEEVAAFLKRSFFVSQLVNDLHDQPGDVQRGQPNFWNGGSSSAGQPAALFLGELQGLSRQADGLPGQFREYGRIRVSDIATYGVQVIDQVRPLEGAM